MKPIMTLVLLTTGNNATTVFAGPIFAVLMAFSVVVGVALERFLKDHLVVSQQKFEGWRHELCYWSALAVLISVSIRFLVGSEVHLHMVYTAAPTAEILRRFLKDLFFLFVFGSFLVRVALAVSLRQFVFWLMLFSGASFIWSLIEVMYSPEPLAWPWFFMDGSQLVATFVCWCLAPPKEGTGRSLVTMVILVIVFGVLFWIDLWHILDSSPGWFLRAFHA